MTLLDPQHEVLLDAKAPTPHRRVRLTHLLGAALVVLLLAAAALQLTSGSKRQQPASTPAATPLQAPAGAGGIAVPPVAGATQLVNGVAVGYPHTAAGAVAAATNYLVAQSDPQMYVADRRHAVLETIAAPGQADQLIAQVEPGIQLAARGLGLDASGRSNDGVLVSRVLPLGWHLDSYQSDRARVAVWYGTLAGVAALHSQTPVTTEYATESIDLVWAAGDWKWSGLVHADGPAPVGGVQPPSSADQIALAVQSFQPYAYGSHT